MVLHTGRMFAVTILDFCRDVANAGHPLDDDHGTRTHQGRQVARYILIVLICFNYLECKIEIAMLPDIETE